MSVVVRGMKMPTSCSECERCGYYGHEEHMCDLTNIRVEYADGLVKRRDDCPLVEIPAEHGRLGDLDAMAFDESEAYMSAQAKLGRDVITTGINSIVHRKIQLLIMDTPTVIEAEGTE